MMSTYGRKSYDPLELMTKRFSRRAIVRTGAAGLAVGALAGAPGIGEVKAQGQACGGEDITITYGFWDAAQRPAVEEQIKVFREQNPNITVEPQVVPFDDYWTKLQTGVAGGAIYDVFWMNAPNLPVFASQGALLPLTEITGTGGVDLSVYPEALVNTYTFEGTVYGISRDFDTIALFYNKEHFDEAGVAYPTADWTWDDLRKAAEQLTAGEGRWGFAASLSDQQNYFNFIKQNGGEILSEDLTRAMLDEPASCEALRFVTDFYTAGLTPSVAVQQANDPYDSLFPAGAVAMIPGGSWHVRTFSEANPAIAVAPLPQRKQRASMIHGLANVIWAKSPNQCAAMEFVKFLGSQEAEQILGASATVIPSMAGLQEAWVASVPEMDLQIFLDAVDYSFPLPSPPSGPEWRDNVEEILVKAWSGEIPADQLCTQVAEGANTGLAAQ